MAAADNSKNANKTIHNQPSMMSSSSASATLINPLISPSNDVGSAGNGGLEGVIGSAAGLVEELGGYGIASSASIVVEF